MSWIIPQKERVDLTSLLLIIKVIRRKSAGKHIHLSDHGILPITKHNATYVMGFTLFMLYALYIKLHMNVTEL
jgi:hypothetical protein